jgi:hypothetical protein
MNPTSIGNSPSPSEKCLLITNIVHKLKQWANFITYRSFSMSNRRHVTPKAIVIGCFNYAEENSYLKI